MHGHAALGVGDGAQNFGDDLVGAADEHAGAHFDVLAHEIAVIIQRGAAHGRTCEVDGLHLGEGGEFARPPYLPEDVEDSRFGFLRLELIGDGPAREFVGIAELFPDALLVDLDDGAVRENVNVLALYLYLIDGCLHFVVILAHFEEGIGLEALLF